MALCKGPTSLALDVCSWPGSGLYSGTTGSQLFSATGQAGNPPPPGLSGGSTLALTAPFSPVISHLPAGLGAGPSCD